MKFKPFSRKQMKVMCWWTPQSPYRDCDAIICDGAVRSGKTLCTFLSFMLWSVSSFSDTSFAICGRTVSSVRRNIILPMLPMLKELGFKCDYSLSRATLTVSYGGVTNTYLLFGGKDEASASLIQGMTLGGVLLDEVALMPRSFVEQALARCSLPGSKFWFNCNPDNPSHWFYNEWILKAKQKNALYLHFKMSENPSLSPKMLKRYEGLYSGVFYERFILGKWVAAEGLVYPMFGNGCTGVPSGDCDRYFVSCDYGTVNPSSFGLWGRCGGVWYRIDEYYYDSKKEGQQLTDEEYYEALEDLIGGLPVSAVICDPSAASFIACIRRHGKYNVRKAKNDVIDGIRRVADALKSGKIKISPCCRDSICEFSLYRWDSGGAKDSVKKENDHAMDDIRYFVATALGGSGGGPVAASAERFRC